MSDAAVNIVPMHCNAEKEVEAPFQELRLAIVTPARNEAQFIELTIKSVIEQAVQPVKWIIVSDGSTDGTDDIVRKYAVDYPWIELVQMPERRERHFAGKVHAFNAGYARLKDVQYDVLGNLDADITFDREHFDFLLKKFVENPQLGVAGAPFMDKGVQYDFRVVSLQHVSGCCQLFRRRCFEDIGGYLPVRSGGIDLLAVISARMRGWQTRTFLGKPCIHHRKMGSAKHGVLKGAFLGGRADYVLGCDPLWQVGRSVYRTVKSRPFILDGVLCMAGYLWAASTRTKKAAPPALVRFRRTEERHRLIELLKKAFSSH